MVGKPKKTLPPVSVIIAHRNSSSTVLHTLEGVRKQDYPIKEVVIVDNHSTDDSLDKIRKFSDKNKLLNIKILLKDKNRGLSNSFNMGVKAAKSNHVIIMQADGVLPSDREISIIMNPVFRDKTNSVAASTPLTQMPEYVWNRYNFWEKCMFSGSVNRKVEGFNGKFDYVNKKLYFKAGGYDEKNFNAGVGGEDADLTMRLKKVGKVVKTKARVIHLHYLGGKYAIMNWMLNRKLFARSYGRIIRMYGLRLPLDVLMLLIKPILAFGSFIPFLFPYNLITMFIFSVFYMGKIYTSKETASNVRIILVPFISIALIYYETFWMFESFLTPVKKWEGLK